MQNKKNKAIESTGLVELQSYIPNAVIDLKYATADNFTGQVVYDKPLCLLHRDAAVQLQKAEAELEESGLYLKIWDGYRPYEAQEKFWRLIQDERYVSNPRKGGRHTRGTSVDVTLITRDSQELRMPTGFDEFCEKAHRDYMGASEEELRNRELLQTVMEKHGFIGLPTEWWHFDLEGWENYPSVNISL